jgi:hypothetical protein
MRLNHGSHVAAGFAYLNVHVAALGLQFSGHPIYERLDLATVHQARCSTDKFDDGSAHRPQAIYQDREGNGPGRSRNRAPQFTAKGSVGS